MKVIPVMEKSLKLKKIDGNRKGAEKKNRYNRSRQEWRNRSSNHPNRKQTRRQA